MSVFTILALLSVAAGPVSALYESAPAASTSADTIGAIDTDGNGKVSLLEIQEFARKNGITSEEIRADFQDLDTNADGELDAQEMSHLLSPASSAAAPHAKAEPAPAAKVQPAAAPITKVQRAPAMPVETPRASSTAADAVPGLKALELDARHQAGAIVAEGLAKRAQAMMKQGQKDEKDAESFEAKALLLRGTAAGAAKTMGAEARRASEAAVHNAGKKGLAEAQRLKDKSEKLEKDAHEHHERATQALMAATEAQEILVTKH